MAYGAVSPCAGNFVEKHGGLLGRSDVRVTAICDVNNGVRARHAVPLHVRVTAICDVNDGVRARHAVPLHVRVTAICDVNNRSP